MKTYDAEPGENIHSAARNAIARAKEAGERVTLLFNELEIAVSPQSFADDIAMIYNLKSEVRRHASR
jgi:hypothetical protein